MTPDDWLQNVPPAKQGCSFETFDLSRNPGMRAALEQCRKVAAGSSPFAFLGGNPGLGKTHLAIATMRAFGPMRSIFWRVPDFIEAMYDFAYGREMGMANVLRSYLTGDFLLVLDDLGREKRTERAQETLFRVLDSRSADRLPTVITTNCLADDIDAAVRSRFREGRVICRGVDVRGKVAVS